MRMGQAKLESPTDRAFAFARYQGPSPLPAVLHASRGRTPSSDSAARRRRGVFHCRHMAALSRNRIQRVKPIQGLRRNDTLHLWTRREDDAVNHRHLLLRALAGRRRV
jgi:hypothetical protein